VRSGREASDDDLFENTLVLALSALSMGTTTVEMKSGYGLDTETELRMLSVIRRVGR
jgi:imidazolonepropionase